MPYLGHLLYIILQIFLWNVESQYGSWSAQSSFPECVKSFSIMLVNNCAEKNEVTKSEIWKIEEVKR